MTINDCLPLLKHELVLPPQAPGIRHESPGESAFTSGRFGTDGHGAPARTSALKAGWICVGIGAAIAWIFPPALLFYSVAMIMAIIAMVTKQVLRGVVLLVSSLLGLVALVVIMMTLTVGAIAVATGGLSKQLKGQSNGGPKPATSRVPASFSPSREANRPWTTVQPT